MSEDGDLADRYRRHLQTSRQTSYGRAQRHLPAHPALRCHIEGVRRLRARPRRARAITDLAAAAGQPGDSAGARTKDRASTAHRHHAPWTHPGGGRAASS